MRGEIFENGIGEEGMAPGFEVATVEEQGILLVGKVGALGHEFQHLVMPGHEQSAQIAVFG